MVKSILAANILTLCYTVNLTSIMLNLLGFETGSLYRAFIGLKLAMYTRLVIS